MPNQVADLNKEFIPAPDARQKVIDDILVQAIVRNRIIHPVAVLQIELVHGGEADEEPVLAPGLPPYMPYTAFCCR